MLLALGWLSAGLDGLDLDAFLDDIWAKEDPQPAGAPQAAAAAAAAPLRPTKRVRIRSERLNCHAIDLISTIECTGSVFCLRMIE